MDSSPEKKKNSIVKVGSIWLILTALIVAACLISISVGSAGYSLGEILHALTNAEKTAVRVIVMDLRMPRILLALLIGSSLAAAGSLMQAVMRNPLADPGTIGVSAGASTVAVTVILVFPALMRWLPLFSFIGAGLAFLLVYSLAWKEGVSPVRIILAGVVVNSVLTAYTSLIQLLNSENLQAVFAFTHGSLSARSWVHVRMAASYIVIGLLAALLCTKMANVLQLGDEVAKSLGVRVSACRLVLSAVASFLAAAAVSVVGIIGFVGLVVPHIARLMVGSDYKVLLPTSILLGGLVLLVADTIGRTIAPGMEIPVGIIMAVTGGPYFLYKLRKQGKMYGG